MSAERIDKIIASQGGFSRSQARKLVREGQVLVNGRAVSSADQKVEEGDSISVSGRRLLVQQYVYLMLNKPAGVLSASTDPSRKTVVDLVPRPVVRPGLFPVGRLDKDTTGLLLITNDGDFAHRVISPKSKIEKVYHAVLDGPVGPEKIRQFEDGVRLADGTLCLPARLCVLRSGEQPLAEVVIMEGRYHQVKRMFGTCGLGVVSLRRVQVGELLLDPELPEGGCRELSEAEKQLVIRPKQ